MSTAFLNNKSTNLAFLGNAKFNASNISNKF